MHSAARSVRASRRNNASGDVNYSHVLGKCVKLWYFASVARRGWVSPRDILEGDWVPNHEEMRSMERHFRRNILGRVVMHTTINALLGGIPAVIALGVGCFFSMHRKEEIKVGGEMYDTLKTLVRLRCEEAKKAKSSRRVMHFNDVYVNAAAQAT